MMLGAKGILTPTSYYYFTSFISVITGVPLPEPIAPLSVMVSEAPQ